MINFTNKKIKSVEILGDILKEKRKQHDAELSQVAKDLMIDKQYLQALEDGDYESLPTDTYSLQFLKKYSQFLELDYNKIKQKFLQEKDLFFKSKDIKIKPGYDFNPTKKMSRMNFLIIPKIWRNLIIISIILSFFVYFGWSIKKMFTPPFLTIQSPENNLIVSEREVEVIGQTEKEVKLLINGQDVLSDSEGNFNKNIDLQKGINIIKISAATKHSRENVVYLKVMVE